MSSVVIVWAPGWRVLCICLELRDGGMCLLARRCHGTLTRPVSKTPLGQEQPSKLMMVSNDGGSLVYIYDLLKVEGIFVCFL